MNLSSSITHAIAVALVVTLTGATGATAFERARSEVGAPMRWPKDAPIRYALVGEWTSEERAAIERAVATWRTTKCAPLEHHDDLGGTGVPPVTITRGMLDTANATLAAQTKLETTKPRRGVIERARIVLNEKRRFTTSASPVDTFDLETVVLHELGHALGLAHPTQLGVNASVVMRAGIKAGEVKRTLDDDDIKGACN